MQNLKYLNINQALNWSKQNLKKARLKSAELEADLFLAHILKKDKTFLYLNPSYELNKKEELAFRKIIAQRINNEPVAYILGFKEFYGLKFLVNKNVLIPRPETELIVEEVLNKITLLNQSNIVLIDVGTGSGCLPIAIAKKLYNVGCIKYYGVDISKKALVIAHKNAELHGVQKKIKFYKSDLLSYFFNSLFIIRNSNLIITANLPYLSANIYQKNYHNLQFEPQLALAAGQDGLKYYRKLLPQIKKIANCCSLNIYLEINPEQKNKIQKIIIKYLPKAKIEFQKDLAGRNRLVVVNLN